MRCLLKKKIILRFFAIFAILMMAFQNCSPSKLKMKSHNSNSQPSVSPTATPNEFTAINYFTEDPPELICGEEGYEFLMNQYILNHCASCHNSTGFAPRKFAQPGNVNASYREAQRANEDRFITGVLEGPFCGPTCNLDEDGEVFQGIKEWLENKTCP